MFADILVQALFIALPCTQSLIQKCCLKHACSITVALGPEYSTRHLRYISVSCFLLWSHKQLAGSIIFAFQIQANPWRPHYSHQSAGTRQSMSGMLYMHWCYSKGMSVSEMHYIQYAHKTIKRNLTKCTLLLMYVVQDWGFRKHSY